MKTNKINHKPIYLDLCIETYSNKIGKLHKKLSGQKGLLKGECHFYSIHLYCLSLRQWEYIHILFRQYKN